MTPDDRQSAQTAEILRRFNECFLRHDPSGLAELVAEDCTIENTQPAPDGDRYSGREACVALWTKIITTPGTWFEPEEVIAFGERGIILWRLRWGDDHLQSIRGVNIMLIRNGCIVEAKGYVKGS